MIGEKVNSQEPQKLKRPLTAFFLYKNEVYDQVKAQNPEAKITEITQIIAKMWNNADQATKERFEKEYQENKKEYQKSKGSAMIEKANFVQQNEIDMIKPEPPKRALSPFFLFRNEVHDQVKAENPEAKITEITQIIAIMWKDADQATKERFEKEHQKNKEQALKQRAEYEAKYGKIH